MSDCDKSTAEMLVGFHKELVEGGIPLHVIDEALVYATRSLLGGARGLSIRVYSAEDVLAGSGLETARAGARRDLDALNEEL